MMRTSVLLLLSCLPSMALACSSSSSSPGAHEAGVDAPADVDEGGCFPFCSSSSGSSGGSGDDGGAEASCAELKDQIETLQAPAQACDPTKPSQCNGIADGICCPITVTAGNDQAANAYEQAVTSYKTQCDASCITPVCPTAPSLHCNTVGTQGLCQ
ncbi:MAG TPA: hypothetical protein VGL81_33485 [Polyangiaceae bacterium]|jgi:hypothetical protein